MDSTEKSSDPPVPPIRPTDLYLPPVRQEFLLSPSTAPPSSVRRGVDATTYALRGLRFMGKFDRALLDWSRASPEYINAVFPALPDLGPHFPPTLFRQNGILLQVWRDMTQPQQERWIHFRGELPSELQQQIQQLLQRSQPEAAKPPPRPTTLENVMDDGDDEEDPVVQSHDAGRCSLPYLQQQSRPVLDRLDYRNCSQTTVDALFPLLPQKGPHPPPRDYRRSGVLLREWRLLREDEQLVEQQRSVRSSSNPPEQRRRDKMDFTSARIHTIKQWYPIIPGCGTLDPPYHYLKTGWLLAGWRRYARDTQEEKYQRYEEAHRCRKRGRPKPEQPAQMRHKKRALETPGVGRVPNESAGKDLAEQDPTVPPQVDAGKYLLANLQERTEDFLDTLNYKNATQRCIVTLFPLQKGKGTLFPPPGWHEEGRLIRFWRNMSQEMQEIHTSQNGRAEKLLDGLDALGRKARWMSITSLQSHGTDVIDAMDYTDCSDDMINSLFKLRVGGGNFHPPRVYLKSGTLVREWRKMPLSEQTVVLRQHGQDQTVTVSPHARPLANIIPEKDGGSYKIRGLKMMNEQKRDSLDYRNTPQETLDIIFPQSKGKLPPPPYWRRLGSAIREWRHMAATDQIEWILDEEIGRMPERHERRNKRKEELVEEERQAAEDAENYKNKKNHQPPGPCQGITLRTVDVFKGKNKELVADGFFHMIGEAMNERSAAYASRAPWPYDVDVLGILPDLQKKPGETEAEKEPAIRFILRQALHHPIHGEPAQYCSFHSVDCSGTEESTESGRVLAVGKGMCKNCRLGRNNFFTRAEGTAKLYNDLKPHTSNARVAKSPHLLSMKLNETTKKLKTLSSRLYARTQRENAKANVAANNPAETMY